MNLAARALACCCALRARIEALEAAGGGGGCDLELVYSTENDPPVANGFITFGDSSPHASSTMWIFELDGNGVDISSILATLGVGDVIKITNSNHEGSYVLSSLTEVGTDEGDYWEFDNMNDGGSGTDTWETGDPLCLTIFDAGGVPTLAEVLLTSADAGGSVITNGGISPAIKITAANYTVGTTNLMELYGGIIYVTAAATLTIPSVDADMHFTVVTIGNFAVSVDPNAADLIYLDGVPLSDGDKITNLSTAGDIAVFSFFDANGFYASTNGWTDTN